MKILWLTWKDRSHPEAGGAEVVCRELTDRLAADGHEVTILTCRYPGAERCEHTENGITYIRVGTSRYLHPLQASAYFYRNLRRTFDLIIEEVNGAPYFSVLMDRRTPSYVFYHQLQRRNWFHETKPPLSYIGHYLLEPVATRLVGLARRPVITVSESTRKDLGRYGLNPLQTRIISEGLEIEPVADIHEVRKYARPTLLSLGNLRAMKRTIHQIRAFEIAKRAIPELRMKIAGQVSGTYGQSVLEYIKRSPYAEDIEYLGRVSREEKKWLMRHSHLITVTSVKEGWGLIVTEAASQGTPAIVYNVDGLRDSVRHNRTGLVTPERPDALADGIINLLRDRQAYDRLRQAAWQWSQTMTFDRSYKDFMDIVGGKA